LPARRRTEITHPAGTAAFIYSGISVAAAVAFFLVTTFVAGYPAVARYGGAAWIFLLMMIVLMPIVIPRVQKRAKKRPEMPGTGSGSQAGETGACTVEPLPQLGDVPQACPIEEPTAEE
jgi:hypothetical protein